MSDPSNQPQRVIAEHIESMRPQVCDLIDKLFAEISSPQRIEVATYPQLVQAIQALLKGFADEEQREHDQGKLSEILGNYFENI